MNPHEMNRSNKWVQLSYKNKTSVASLVNFNVTFFYVILLTTTEVFTGKEYAEVLSYTIMEKRKKQIKTNPQKWLVKLVLSRQNL